MTRKQAILGVIAKFEGKKEYRDKVDKLKEICKIMPFTGWDCETIKDSVECFMSENKRVPSVTDFNKKNGLPSPPSVKSRLKMTVGAFLSKYFPAYYEPCITRKQALLFAHEALKDKPDLQEKIEELIEEYPVCRWTPKNIADGVTEFYRVNGRLPYERELGRQNNLPDYKHFAYKFGMSPARWYSIFCEELYKENEQNKHLFKRDYLKEFKDEYLRVRPYSKDDFNNKRDGANCCTADVVMKNSGINSWQELLKVSGVPFFADPHSGTNQIKEVEVIVLNENKEVLYTYTLDNFEYDQKLF